MPNPIVHFEIIGSDPSALQTYYGELFGWDTSDRSPVSAAVSETDSYSLIQRIPGPDNTGIPGGIGGGIGFPAHTIFYVGVDDVADALQVAEQLGGRCVLPPSKRPDGNLVVAQFADPEGNVIGLAGPK